MISKLILLMLSAALCIDAGVPKSKYVRPCYLNDYDCVRKNLIANSRCNPNIEGTLPSEYKVNKFRYEAPFFNSSYIENNLIVRNHDACFVSEFFYNVESDTAILGLDCPNLNLESQRTLIQHRSLLEDSTFSYKINGTYPLIRLTTSLKANDMDLCNAFTFADVVELPIFHVDPNDKPTANFLSKDLTMLNIYERETFFYRAKYLAEIFINAVLCDFYCYLNYPPDLFN